MKDLRDQILENIRNEVRAYLKTGKKVPSTRDARWDADIQRILAEERITVRHELEDTLYRSYYNTLGSDISFEDWMDIAKSLYKINDDFSVTSIARGPDHSRTVECISLKAAHKRIITLIRTKKYDHFVRGFTFMYLPEVKAAI